ncbi:uncharacterized protein LOC135485637 isoform X6 [Lineus longissimus]|uniref:uncharacterized protein LOC135485637 isoform X6 n=1 Tax=Lineus longissimus TaxID=88925 RepID=UPI00315DFF70
MKSIVAVVVLILCMIFFTNGTGPFFGNKYWILLGQTKPGNHHPGITIKEETNVTINETRNVDGCLNSWIFTSGWIYFSQDGSLDFVGKSFTVGGYYYYTDRNSDEDIPVMILWHPGLVYLAQFGAKPNARSYYSFRHSSSLKVNSWVFVGFSLDSSGPENKLMGWVDDVVTRKSIFDSIYKDVMKSDIVFGKYFKRLAPFRRTELAGMTVMEGSIEPSQIETFKADILSTLTPTCQTSTTATIGQTSTTATIGQTSTTATTGPTSTSTATTGPTSTSTATTGPSTITATTGPTSTSTATTGPTSTITATTGPTSTSTATTGPGSGGGRAAGLSRFPLATMMTLALIVGAMLTLQNQS